GAASISRLLGHMRLLLEAMAMEPKRLIGGVNLLTDWERQQVLVEWNQMERAYGKWRVQELFERQVKLSPESVALIYEDQQLSYGALNERANRLAHHLIKLGVGAEVRVGLCLERGLEMVVGLLAVLKAGGAYVPFEATYPSRRLEQILEDS